MKYMQCTPPPHVHLHTYIDARGGILLVGDGNDGESRVVQRRDDH